MLCFWIWGLVDKTVIALTALNELKYNFFKAVKILVIAPKKVAESTWLQEAKKWDHLSLLRFSCVMGTERQRIKALYSPADIYVINRENVVWLCDYKARTWDFDTVIIDESSSFKSHTAKRFRALARMRDKIERIVLLTGTPAPNSLMDLWSQIYLIDKGARLGNKIGQFRERFFNAEKIYGVQGVCNYKEKADSGLAVHNLISDVCVSMKASDYLELPDCLTYDKHVLLDSKSRKAYNSLEREMILAVKDKEITATSAAALSTKLLQLCNGAVYDEDGNAVDVHNCKLEVLGETVESLNGSPCIVFYNYKHDLGRITSYLSKLGIKSFRTLKTQNDIDDWNAGKISVLLAHPQSSAYGLNLQDGGNQIIWFSLPWSLELYQQANKRLHRQGQTQKVIIQHLIVEGGRDEDVMRALVGKDTTQEALLQSLKARIDNYN